MMKWFVAVREMFRARPVNDGNELTDKLARRRQQKMADGVVQLKKGQVIKIDGIPLWLEADAEASTHPDNVQLIDKKLVKD